MEGLSWIEPNWAEIMTVFLPQKMDFRTMRVRGDDLVYNYRAERSDTKCILYMKLGSSNGKLNSEMVLKWFLYLFESLKLASSNSNFNSEEGANCHETLQVSWSMTSAIFLNQKQQNGSGNGVWRGSKFFWSFNTNTAAFWSWKNLVQDCCGTRWLQRHALINQYLQRRTWNSWIIADCWVWGYFLIATSRENL